VKEKHKKIIYIYIYFFFFMTRNPSKVGTLHVPAPVRQNLDSCKVPISHRLSKTLTSPAGVVTRNCLHSRGFEP